MKVLEDPTERERLVEFDNSLLTTDLRTVTTGDVVTESVKYALNTEREYERYLEIVESMDVVVNGHPNERMEKGLSVETVAEMTFGSRNVEYTRRVAKALIFSGPINQRLSNGHIVDSHKGLVIKTGSLEDAGRIAQTLQATTITAVERSLRRQFDKLNDVSAMVVRRIPAAADYFAEMRKDVYAELQTTFPSRLKAIEPSPKKK